MVSGAVDPFEAHYAVPDVSGIEQQIASVRNGNLDIQNQKHKTLGRVTIITPKSSRKRKHEDLVKNVGLFDLKKRLVEPAEKHLPNLSDLQSHLAPDVLNYKDLLFGARTPQNADDLRKLTVLHALNHLFKTRDRVIKNNAKLSGADPEKALERELRDQGFTRPKILILLETRQQCVKWIDTIITLSDPDQQENKKRFQDAFAGEENKFGDEKPEDFRELFEGNDDNDFRLGLKFTRKTLKFYSQFYNADIILASPLGLRRAVKPDDPKKADSDFLSSIEICIVDQADAMLMQNWEHVEFAFEHLNKQPRDPHGCDFSRVRQWYLDGNAKHFRQTLVFSQYLTPELNGLFSQHMQNMAGKVKIQPEHNGSMLDVDFQARQTFNRLPSKDPASDPDERFKYFTTIVMPAITRIPQPAEGGLGVLIFIPNYYDFVRVRNFFAGDNSAQDLSFGTASEYDEPAVQQRARSHFLSGKQSVLLYTGRAHHFRRLMIRGVSRVYFYSLPENPKFYSEIVNFIGASIDEGRVHQSDAVVKAIFSRWEAMALERIVGTQRVKRMLKDGAGDTFDFR